MSDHDPSEQDQVQPSPFFKWLDQNGWVFWVIGLVITIAIGFLIYQNTKPKQGGILYGICHTLMDFEYQFTHTFDVLTVNEGRRDVRIFMAETNSFGQERIVQIDCDFSIANNEILLTRLAQDRKPIPSQRVEYYNRLMPTLVSMQDALKRDLPKPLPRSLQELKR